MVIKHIGDDNMAKARNDSLDIAKGIGIILVVFGHTLSPVMKGHSILEWIYSVIYTFHMPLFFFISGYFASKLITKPVSKPELIKQRTIRLMIPYFVWALIYLPMKVVMSQYARFHDEYKWYSIFFGNNPDGQLWYLYVLFILSVLMILVVTKKNLAAFTTVFLVGSFMSGLIPFSIGFTSITLTFSLYQAGFFFLGTLTSVKFDYQKVTGNIYAFFLSLIVLISYSVILWFNNDEVWYLRAIVAACAIYAVLFLCNIINNTKAKRPLVYLGKTSMEIYILHGPLLVAGRIVLPKIIHNTNVYIIVLTAASIAISLLCAFVINKIGLAKLLLFGSASTTKKGEK